MDPSRAVNLRLSVEQVNPLGDDALPDHWHNRSAPQPPLDNVVDPNTEFKRAVTASPNAASPELSFGLKDVLHALQSRASAGQDNSLADIEQTAHPDLYQQLQQAYNSAVVALHSRGSDGVAKVHQSPKRVPSLDSQHSATTPPVQVATILKENEPQLVSDLLSLLGGAPPSAAPMEGYPDLSAFTIDVPPRGDAVAVGPTMLGAKPLHKFPPGHVTVSCERGSPRPPDPAPYNPYRRNLAASRAKHTSPDPWPPESARYDSISNISDISLYNPEQRNVPTSPTSVRSPEQIAWAMRNARNRYETGSNFSACSSNLDSVCSERMDTMSMISDVSGYEEEMFRIKKLLLDPTTGKSRSVSHPPTQHSAPPVDLAATHTQASVQARRHQEELATVRKSYETRLQEAQCHQAHTEGQLEASKQEVSRLGVEQRQLMARIAELESQHSREGEVQRLSSQLAEWQQRAEHLEGSLGEAQGRLQQHEAEAQQWREERQAGEHEASRLRLELEEARISLETRAAAAEGLRAKVAEQHSELQGALQARLQAEGATSLVRSEVEALRSSQLWYKEQLARAQTARSTAQQHASAASAELALRDSTIESLRSQVASLSNQLAEAERHVVREKRALLQQLETFEADMAAREAELTHRQTGRTPPSPSHGPPAPRLAQLEASLAELQLQLESAQSQLRASEEGASQLSVEHAQLLGRTSTLRQSLAERDLQLQQASDQLSSLDAHNCRLRLELKDKDRAALEARGQLVRLQVALEAANREKGEVDQAIESLSQEFTQISARYQRMKQEIRDKDELLATLQTGLGQATAERDGLRAELEDARAKLRDDSETIHKLNVGLQQENEHFKTELASSEQDKANFEMEMVRLKARLEESEAQAVQQLQQNQELAGRIAELTAGKNRAERKAAKLQESLTFREEQLLTAQQGMESAHTAAREASEREQQTGRLEGEVSRLTEELSRSDAVVQQYAELCRSQEQRRTSRSDAESQSDRSDVELVRGGVDFCVQSSPVVRSVGVDGGARVRDQETQTDLVDTVETHGELSSGPAVCGGDVEAELHAQIARLTQQVEGVDEVRLRAEAAHLRDQLLRSEAQNRELKRKHQANVGTLLRKLKEHMRGRRSAERELEAALSRLAVVPGPGAAGQLEREISELQERLRASTERLEHLREAEGRAAEAVLELQRERGRLEGLTGQQQSLRERLGASEQELLACRRQLEEASEATRSAQSLASQQAARAEEAAARSSKMIRDLQKQGVAERSETTALRHQLQSLNTGLETANQLLEARGVELAGVRERLEQQRGATEAAVAQSSASLAELHTAQARVQQLTQELQLSKDKDPLLAEQIKRVSELAQQRGAEAEAARTALQQAEQRWEEQRSSLASRVDSLEAELAELRVQLDSERQQRFALQAVSAELKGALEASLQECKVLRSRLSGLESAQSLPDLTSSLPVPTALDEAALSELLRRSAAPPPPLAHLQSCLRNLQQEVRQLEQRASPSSASQQRLSNGVQ